jgi:2-C-methyl-D-erythritol 4-phosphate cytidylyltransferase
VSVCAIIAAAGRGERMSSPIPKQFWAIKNKPILVYTLEKFCQCQVIDSIIIVVPKDWTLFTENNIVNKFNIIKVRQIIEGGATRQESVFKALQSVDETSATVAIHDAVRPLVSLELLNKVIDKGRATGAAVLAVPIYDSLKKVTSFQIEGTLTRDSTWLVQTPQVFKRDLIINAYQQAFFNCIKADDDAELVEYLGHPIHVVEGSRTNIKITTPADLNLAKVLLRSLS